MFPHKTGLSAAMSLLMGLCGCAGSAAVTPSTRLIGPDAAVMMPASPLPDPVKDEDAKELLKQCRAAYGRETDKLPQLQSFAKRVTRAPKQ